MLCFVVIGLAWVGFARIYPEVKYEQVRKIFNTEGAEVHRVVRAKIDLNEE